MAARPVDPHVRLTSRDRLSSIRLDLLRFIAALLVVIGHLRALLFVSYPELANPGPLTKAFYLGTGLGHQAVILFFVLSGAFVGHGVLRRVREQSFSWSDYLAARSSRLVPPLMAALLLTLLFDTTGIACFGTVGPYDGSAAADPALNLVQLAPEQLGPAALLGNLAFCQTILVPTFGSNAPLWSLANEGWYYLLFPFLAVVLCRGPTGRRSIAAIAVAAGLAFVGPAIAGYFVIWLLGVAAPWLATRWRRLRSIPLGAALIGFLAVLALVRVHPFAGGDLLLGIATTLFVARIFASPAPARGNRWERLTRAGAGFSYTLYLTHLPLLVFARAWLTPHARWTMTADHLLVALALATAVVTACYLLSRFTEAHTDTIRQRIRDHECRRSHPSAAHGAS